MRSTRAGELLRASLDIDFSRQAGISISADDVSCEEFTVLKIISAERVAYDVECHEARRREQEHEAAKGRR
jgi:hypothetical protein